MNPQWLVGKVIEKVNMNSFSDGRGGTTHDPVVTFTDGSSLQFTVDETDGTGSRPGDYGISFRYEPVRKTKKS